MADSTAPLTRDQFPLLPPYVAPRTATEGKIAEIWRGALGVDRVGITDSYEDLGGSSLMAASICVELEKAFGIKIDMNMILDTPTIEELASTVDDLTHASKG